MPRKGRLYVPGGLFHILGRGLERRHIFKNAVDKRDFLERLGDGLYKTGHRCYAWALMDNHYHLLLRQSEAPLATLMGPLLGGYALSFNSRYRRSGYLYQGRNRSILCEEDSYFNELLRYIHLNPLKARMVEDEKALAHYPWTGHSVILGNQSCSWQNVDEVLRRFGSVDSRAKQRYREFVIQGISSTVKVDFDGGGLVRSEGGKHELKVLRKEKSRRLSDPRILGSGDFVARVLRDIGHEVDRAKGWNLVSLACVVCAYYDVGIDQLKTRARGNAQSKARSLVAYYARCFLGVSVIEISHYLAMSHQGASKAVVRGRLIVESEEVSLDLLGC